jgi:hypothetical protein
MMTRGLNYEIECESAESARELKKHFREKTKLLLHS